MSRFNKTAKDYKTTIGCSTLLVAVLVFLGTCVFQVVASIQFDRHYKGHLKRAADANSLELAEKELQIAYDYLKLHGLTTEAGRNSGWLDDNTNILYTTPDNQISFHVDNVKASLDDVQEVRAKGDAASALERSNVLMKLRESLLDDGEGGHHVTCPTGLEIFPYNIEVILATLGSIGVFFLAGGYLKLKS